MSVDEITKYVTEKYVKIPFNGPIYTKACIYGPTLPERMPVSEIAMHIQKGYPVVELLANGKEVKLNMVNYNVDLNGDGGASVQNIAQPVEATPGPVAATTEEKVDATATATTDAKTEEVKTATVNATTDAKADDKSADKAGATVSATTVKVTATPSTSNSKADVLKSK